MDNWKLVEQSNTRNACVNTFVNNIPVTFIRTENGLLFTLAVPEEYLPRICARITELLLKRSRPIGTRYAIGRINRHDGGFPLMDGDKDLNQFIKLCAGQLSLLVENYGCWQSLNELMKVELGYLVKLMPDDMQPAFEYWWLVGSMADGRPVHETHQYKDIGIFVRPEDGVLPIFTSSLYADMASQLYSEVHGLRLLPVRIPCPSCYLSGLGDVLGSEILRGAILNEQWRIRFFTCDEKFYSSPSHFYISDSDGEEYALAGCPDKKMPPHWVIRQWGHDEVAFPKKCKPLPWSLNTPERERN